MPITCRETLIPLSREAFGQLAYELMRDVFAIRNELGRFFDEKHNKRALALRRKDVKFEVPVYVSYQSFEKTYFLDALLAAGAVIEFKAIEILTNRHQAQLLHYQMLTELSHGLLLNLRPEQIEKRFVNCPLSHETRHKFSLVTEAWDARLPGAGLFQDTLAQLLTDWGSCLDLSLYEEALTHFLGGEANVIRPVTVRLDGADLGHQSLRLAAERAAFKLTAFDNLSSQDHFVPHARRLIAHTEIDALLWANLGRHEITFRSLKGRD